MFSNSFIDIRKSLRSLFIHTPHTLMSGDWMSNQASVFEVAIAGPHAKFVTMNNIQACFEGKLAKVCIVDPG